MIDSKISLTDEELLTYFPIGTRKPHVAIENLDQFLRNMTEEERENFFPKIEPLPEGWISIEDHLPMVTCGDIINNGIPAKSVKVKDGQGNESESTVGDHHVWYYIMKENGITHWYNEIEEELVEEETKIIL